jgi:hypothetical protein
MVADPEPHKAVGYFDRESPIVTSDSSGPEATDLLEVKGRVSRVLFQTREGPIGKPLDLGRQGIDSTPRKRVRRGESERFGLPGVVVTKGSIGKLVKLAGLNVTLKLAVPSGPVVFQKPGAKLR